jgi:hypothetical protein
LPCGGPNAVRDRWTVSPEGATHRVNIPHDGHAGNSVMTLTCCSDLWTRSSPKRDPGFDPGWTVRDGHFCIRWSLAACLVGYRIGTTKNGQWRLHAA